MNLIKHPSRAFTIVEMLVVVAIIGVLAALLLPALSRAKDKGRGLECLNNTRQLILAWSMFADEHEGELPANMDSGEGVPGITNWIGGSAIIKAEATNTALLRDVERSLLFPYLKSTAVLKCPADKSPNVRSMSMNNRMNPRKPNGGTPVFTGGYGSNYANFYKTSDIRNPSDMFVFLDERSDTINDGYFCVDMSNTGDVDGLGVPLPYYIIDFPASYHNGGSAFTFADGHAEAHRWREATTMPPLGTAKARTYTSTTDPDMQWLQQHTTYLKR